MTAHAIEAPKSRYGAFSHIAFTVMWIATTCSLTGVAISDTAVRVRGTAQQGGVVADGSERGHRGLPAQRLAVARRGAGQCGQGGDGGKAIRSASPV